jgi:hypothetical protein
MSIRVGRVYYKNNKPQFPEYEDYTKIVVLTKSSEYGALGPYELSNNKNQIMENVKKLKFSTLSGKVLRNGRRNLETC